MVLRHRKKKNDNRTHGHGDSARPRGAGNRGGRGRAGMGKKAQHKKFLLLKEEKIKIRIKNKGPGAITLSKLDREIDIFVKKGFAEKVKDNYIFYASKANYEKVLGNGRLTHKIEIRAKKFSKNAKIKITEAGSKFVSSD